eukprot:scaffold2926_cov399-Prasinococcus_capsulatus_cf.AAC.20
MVPPCSLGTRNVHESCSMSVKRGAGAVDRRLGDRCGRRARRQRTPPGGLVRSAASSAAPAGVATEPRTQRRAPSGSAAGSPTRTRAARAVQVVGLAFPSRRSPYSGCPPLPSAPAGPTLGRPGGGGRGRTPLPRARAPQKICSAHRLRLRRPLPPACTSPRRMEAFGGGLSARRDIWRYCGGVGAATCVAGAREKKRWPRAAPERHAREPHEGGTGGGGAGPARAAPRGASIVPRRGAKRVGDRVVVGASPRVGGTAPATTPIPVQPSPVPSNGPLAGAARARSWTARPHARAPVLATSVARAARRRALRPPPRALGLAAAPPRACGLVAAPFRPPGTTGPIRTRQGGARPPGNGAGPLPCALRPLSPHSARTS